MSRFARLRQAKKFWPLVYIFAVPLLLLPLPIYMGNKAGLSAYAMMWMAAYWTAEPIPLAVTALMPLVLFPLFGVLTTTKTTSLYFNNIGFVLFGSLAVAAAVETSRLHQRLALKSLLGIGTSTRRILLGFMLVTMFMSMWIPNTASASIMAPIAVAVLNQLASSYIAETVYDRSIESLEESAECVDAPADEVAAFEAQNENRLSDMRRAMLLAVAYAANIGGTGSLIGTPPNLILQAEYAKHILSSVPAVLVSILLFVVPKDPTRGLQSKGLLTWEEASVKIHWGTIFIICGGMTLAEASKRGLAQDSGLSAILVVKMRGLNVMPSFLVVGVLCFFASMLTEVTSNTAITAIMLPIIFEMAVALEVHPLYFAIPVVVACSFSFMLPAATPPNAIVYEMGNFRIWDMAAPGFAMNMVCVAVELMAIHTLGPLVFGVQNFPAWAALDKNANGSRAGLGRLEQEPGCAVTGVV
ncbi:Na(+)/citrate cotransporter-like [Amblyomma americanum]